MYDENFYITTAIVYPNSKVHIGFAYEVICADFIARYQRLNRKRVFFSTGMDEHSINVVEKAKSLNYNSPQAYCNEMAKEITNVFDKIDISYDNFIRTSYNYHKKNVQRILCKLIEQGDIYLGTYNGLYCKSCESYYTEKDLVDGKCPVHEIEVKTLDIESYFFKLSKYENQLLDLYKSNPKIIQPESRYNEIVKFIESGLCDLSISRKNANWGIAFPNNKDHRVYVWADALLNYISSLEYKNKMEMWPPNIQVIGKDICKFHGVYMLAILISLGMDLPDQIFGHGFINIDGKRMSSTKGNIVDPLEIFNQFGASCLRYYLIRSSSFGLDSNFSIESMIEMYNSDLANNLGNLLNRTIAMIDKYYNGTIYKVNLNNIKDKKIFQVSEQLKRYFEETKDTIHSSMNSLDLSGYLKSVWNYISSTNKYIDKTKPWILGKKPKNNVKLQYILYNLIESLRNISLMVEPIIPEEAQKIRKQIGDNSSKNFNDLKWGMTKNEQKIVCGNPLFEKIDF